MDESNKDRINRVVDYIQANLDKELSVKEISGVACFSEFHFNRIFKNIIGESVYQFIRRIRLERSAGLLLTNPDKSVTEIALMCGFGNSSSFAKSFKNHFKMNASKWRGKSNSFFDRNSTPLQIDRGKISFLKGSPVWTFDKESSIRQVFIEDFEPLKIAYVRNIGPYQGDESFFSKLYSKLFRWATPRGYVNEKTFTLNIYHDNPEITDNQNLRVMVAIPVGNDVKPEGQIGITKINGGRYGVCRFLLKEDEFKEAWNWMSNVWLINSGYEWDNRESFERSIGEENIEDIRYFKVDICIPVKVK
ncbi:MAG: AraC family transcriptional regulator [Deltaproteobacteria bacterium]|nr:AraC family transcriptional regulator [Deltaproteobacteria bacterium]